MFYDISTHFPSVYSIGTGTNSDLVVPKDSYVSSILPHSTQYENRHNFKFYRRSSRNYSMNEHGDAPQLRQFHPDRQSFFRNEFSTAFSIMRANVSYARMIL